MWQLQVLNSAKFLQNPSHLEVSNLFEFKYSKLERSIRKFISNLFTEEGYNQIV